MIAEFLGLLWGEGAVSLMVPDHGCGRQVSGRVSLRVSGSGGVWSRMWLEGIAEDVAWAFVGSVDGGAWSRNGVGGVAEGVSVLKGVLWKVRLLLEIFDCVAGVVLVEVGCGCGWKALRRVSLVLDRKCRRGPYGVACVACRAIKSLGCRRWRRCWRCVNGMWLGGVVRDVDGGVLWRGFFGVVSFNVTRCSSQAKWLQCHHSCACHKKGSRTPSILRLPRTCHEPPSPSVLHWH